jgi:hypothetical protein
MSTVWSSGRSRSTDHHRASPTASAHQEIGTEVRTRSRDSWVAWLHALTLAHRVVSPRAREPTSVGDSETAHRIAEASAWSAPEEGLRRRPGPLESPPHGRAKPMSSLRSTSGSGAIRVSASPLRLPLRHGVSDPAASSPSTRGGLPGRLQRGARGRRPPSHERLGRGQARRQR